MPRSNFQLSLEESERRGGGGDLDARYPGKKVNPISGNRKSLSSRKRFQMVIQHIKNLPPIPLIIQLNLLPPPLFGIYIDIPSKMPKKLTLSK